MATTLPPVDNHTKIHLTQELLKIEEVLQADVVTLVSPIRYGVETRLKVALEVFDFTPEKPRRERLAIILETVGGVVEVVERMVNISRHYYREVYFVIPDFAMSAGTVFAMSGDKIFMSFFSILGPIDPQIEKADGQLVPAMSYLNQFQRLSEKAEAGALNTAEFALLNKLDLGELYQFEQARELSHELLVNWLSTYKFKDWLTHSSNGQPVTEEEKRNRAQEIAASLSDNATWHSHGRGIARQTLRTNPVLRLRIDDIESVAGLEPALDEYYGLLKDYMERQKFISFIHTRDYF